jgi:hypothetical protein
MKSESLKRKLEESDEELKLLPLRNAKPKVEVEAKLHILYQSLEYPKRFTKELAVNLNKLSNVPLIPYMEARDKESYHIAVCDLLKTCIMHIKPKPDIIVLGEYTPNLLWGLNVEDYNLIDYINTTDGKRGMTILLRNGVKNMHRITVHDNRSKIIDHWREDILQKRIAKHNKNCSTDFTLEQYSALREKMRAKWRKAIEHTGECIEIMYANRYIAMAHVPNDNPKASAKASLETCIPFVFMGGDLNVSMSSKKHVKKSKLCDTHTTIINTDVKPLLSNTGSNYVNIQYSYNKEGCTNSSLKFAHDGSYIREQKRTELSIVGSIWPIIDKGCPGISEANTKDYYLMGDHKGFLMTLTTTYEISSSNLGSHHEDEYDNLSTCSVETLKDRGLDLD